MYHFQSETVFKHQYRQYYGAKQFLIYKRRFRRVRFDDLMRKARRNRRPQVPMQRLSIYGVDFRGKGFRQAMQTQSFNILRNT